MNLLSARVITALVTPFFENEIDFPSLKKLIKQQLDGGVQGFIVSGTTAESPTLSFEEKVKLLKFVLSEVAGQVPVLGGSGTFNTEQTIELSQAFEKAKADALMIVTPYYNRPPQRGLYEHYAQIAQKTALPIVLYNVPARTGVNLEPQTVARLAADHKNILAVKEAAGDLKAIEELGKILPKGFGIFSGDDGTFIEAMHLGAHGVMSVISHIVPELCCEYATGTENLSAVKTHIEEIQPLVRALFCETNPIVIKWALHQMGIIRSAELRLPLVGLDKRYYADVKKVLEKFGAL